MKCPEKANVERQKAEKYFPRMGLTVNEHEGFYKSDENVLRLIYGYGCTTQ